MKIRESNTTTSSNAAQVSRLQNRGAAPATGGSPPASGIASNDNVEVSTLRHLLDSQAASQASKLIELSGAVSSGSYQVDPQVLSNKMIQEHMRTAA